MGSTSKRMFETAGNEAQEAPAPVKVSRRVFAGPRSPHDLIQEHYSDDPWKVLCCCIFLNRTNRAQLNKIINEFFSKWPNRSVFHDAKHEDVADVIKSLGFKNRRTDSLKKFTYEFMNWWTLKQLGHNVENVRELPGVGEYAARTFEIFCEGKLSDIPPEDHSVVKYWQWARENIEEYHSGWK